MQSAKMINSGLVAAAAVSPPPANSSGRTGAHNAKDVGWMKDQTDAAAAI